MLSCTDAEVESLLDPKEVISAIREAFSRDPNSPKMPARQHLDLGSGTQLIMPCAIVDDPLWGVKFVSVNREPVAERRVSAFYLLLDSRSSEPIAQFAANYLTEVRTAATSAIATDLLARSDAAVLGIFGTGRQAAAHIAVLQHVRDFERVVVAGTSSDKANAFAKQMSQQHSIQISAVDHLTCAGQSDVICTCTNSEQPLFPGAVVRDGTHLNLIGTFQPHAREVDSELIRRARVFVDTYEGAFAEAGDILVPLGAGETTRQHVLGDLHELVAGLKSARGRPSEVTVFKSVGCALEDLVTAKLVLHALKQRKR